MHNAEQLQFKLFWNCINFSNIERNSNIKFCSPTTIIFISFSRLPFQHHVAFNWKSYLLSSHMTMIWPEEKERVSLPNTQIHSTITVNWSVFCRMQLKKEGRELKVAVVSLSFHEQQRKSDWTHAIRVFLLWATKSSFCIRLAWSKVNTVHYFSSLW